jgi:hypothetical protein
MVGTDTARRFERLAQGTACPMPPDVQVVRRQPELRGHFVRCPLVQVDRRQHGRILRPECREERAEALTQGALILLGGVREVMTLVKPFGPAILDIPPPISVDDRIP